MKKLFSRVQLRTALFFPIAFGLLCSSRELAPGKPAPGEPAPPALSTARLQVWDLQEDSHAQGYWNNVREVG